MLFRFAGRVQVVTHEDQIEDVDLAVAVDVGHPVVAGAEVLVEAVADEDQVEDVQLAVEVGVGKVRTLADDPHDDLIIERQN